MNIGVGSLIFLGLLSLNMGLVNEIKGISLFSLYIESTTGYVLVAITCLISAMVVHEFDKK